MLYVRKSIAASALYEIKHEAFVRDANEVQIHMPNVFHAKQEQGSLAVF